ncbi:MAG: hypothetical protein IJF48_05150 [Clostridia bacterium]|nr:hypothetical protein [Clostridia bacterium]
MLARQRGYGYERGDNQLIIRRFSPLSCSPSFLGSYEVESYIALRAGGVPLRGGGFALLSALGCWYCRATCAAVHLVRHVLFV